METYKIVTFRASSGVRNQPFRELAMLNDRTWEIFAEPSVAAFLQRKGTLTEKKPVFIGSFEDTLEQYVIALKTYPTVMIIEDAREKKGWTGKNGTQNHLKTKQLYDFEVAQIAAFPLTTFLFDVNHIGLRTRRSLLLSVLAQETFDMDTIKRRPHMSNGEQADFAAALFATTHSVLYDVANGRRVKRLEPVSV